MSDITVCVLSCGELTEKQCLHALSPFKKHFKLLRIRNVSPQIKALNQMIERVQTDYFIPVDADIILDRDAWCRITNALNRHKINPEWHTILFPLWDTLTEKRILALKLMRTKILKANPFRESATPDVEHYQRLTSQGFTCIHDYLHEKTIGKHIVKGKRFCYHKYRDVYQTYKVHGWEWDSGTFMGGRDLFERAKCHFHFFTDKWISTGNKDYLWCIAGMIDGIISPTEDCSKNLSKKCLINTKAGFHLFMDWYMKHGPEFQTASFIF